MAVACGMWSGLAAECLGFHAGSQVAGPHISNMKTVGVIAGPWHVQQWSSTLGRRWEQVGWLRHLHPLCLPWFCPQREKPGEKVDGESRGSKGALSERAA
jgi:hypothetical protein